MKKSSNFKWVIMAMVTLSTVPISYNSFQVSALPIEFMQELGIDSVQFTSILTASMLPGVIFAIIGGILADKIGPKTTCTIALVISLVGSLGRLVASNYIFYFICMVMLGFAGTFLSMCAAKLFAQWFLPHEMGIPMGVVLSSGALGTAIAQSTTATLFSGNLHGAYIFGSAWILVMLILWIIIVKENKDQMITSDTSLFTGLKKAVKSRNIWIIGLCAAVSMGYQMIFNSNYIAGMQTTKMIDATIAGLYGTIFTAGGFLGNIIVPMILKKIGVNRPTILIFGLVGAVLSYIAWAYLDGSAMAIVLAIGGLLVFGIMPPLIGYPPLLDEIGPEYAGSAGGLVTTLQMVGAYFLPSSILAPLATANGMMDYDRLFLYGAICAALFGILALILPELGTKALLNRSKEK